LPGGYWGTLPTAWDHPEPNYVVSGAITEFWSVLTTIPVAGALLLYESLKYGYSAQVLLIHALSCAMYTLAFVSHLTLQWMLFSVTVTAVMSNALLTFAQFSIVVHHILERWEVRELVVVAGLSLLIPTVAQLPYALKSNGGVWTLLIVQSPGVFLAAAFAAFMYSRGRTRQERSTYGLVCTSGVLLSSAMVFSLVENLIGFERGFLDWWGFPWIHIIIHVLEQVGIYIFGVGVAALSTLLVEKREDAEVRFLGGWLPYLHILQCKGVELATNGTHNGTHPYTSGGKQSMVEPLEGARAKFSNGARKRSDTPSPGLLASQRQAQNGSHLT